MPKPEQVRLFDGDPVESYGAHTARRAEQATAVIAGPIVPSPRERFLQGMFGAWLAGTDEETGRPRKPSKEQRETAAAAARAALEALS